jgi:hypothetical protein
MEIDQSKPEIRIESEKIFNQFDQTLETKNQNKRSLEIYLLKNKEYEQTVYQLSSDYLKEDMPKQCRVEETKKVVVECFYNGHWGYWKFSPILREVANKSGFSSVDRWLDHWAKTKKDFEFNQKYNIWLLKLRYPAKKVQPNYSY